MPQEGEHGTAPSTRVAKEPQLEYLLDAASAAQLELSRSSGDAPRLHCGPEALPVEPGERAAVLKRECVDP